MTDRIAAAPSQLSDAAPTFHGQASALADVITGLNTTTGGLLTSLSLQPLSGFATDLEGLYGRIGTSMDCLTLALGNLGVSLQAAAQSFAATDAQLASVFRALDQSLNPYLGYDTPAMVPTAPPVVQAPPAHHWWDTLGSWIADHAGQLALVGGVVIVGGVTIVLTGGADTPVVIGAAAAAAG